MPINRFYFDGPFESEILLEGTEHRHLAQVVRGEVGEEIELFNGKGDLAIAVISRLEKKAALCTIKETKRAGPPKKLILAQAIPRINRLDFIVEKCTELGITELRLFSSERSERKELNEHQINRLSLLTIAACKQSGRLWVPVIKCVKPLMNWKEKLSNAIYGDPRSTASPLIGLDKKPELVCIGPESGFTDEEERHLQSLGCTGCNWNEAILRTDTAAISAVAIIQAMH